MLSPFPFALIIIAKRSHWLFAPLYRHFLSIDCLWLQDSIFKHNHCFYSVLNCPARVGSDQLVYMEQTDRNWPISIEVYTNGKTKSPLSPSLFLPSQISPSGRGESFLLYSPLCGDGLASHLLCWGTGHFHRTSTAGGRERGETGVCMYSSTNQDTEKRETMSN